MKYSKEKTLELVNVLDKERCIKDLNTLIKIEGYSGTTDPFSADTVAIDMDRLERFVASSESRNLNRSMDSSFVISNEQSSCIVFVEFRFNYVTIKNVKGLELVEKQQGSCLICTNKGRHNFHSDFYYVFSEGYVQQGKNRLRRLFPLVPNNFVACSIEDIRNDFF